ncbi:hypothetical protein TetV_459 [Tetraselmis virus 1]|uniref:Uncharacterized protein n=1 Tax=Tetraselmis virus 1 TaxID=2060617 RepID=A0A2P0VNQ7_9VIRU|nr:hypothetical protein QJ968_gp595 [Tetraselmis virus 1]AUF82541.1 hypothetical protein TetV_459 [Tetraselmis virus 1]
MVMSAALQDERVQKIIKYLVYFVILVILVLIVAFLLNTPPRSGKMNNFAKPELRSLMDKYSENLSSFWAYHGTDMIKWWENTTDRSILKSVYERYESQGKDSVLDNIFYEAQPEPVAKPGKTPKDARIDFYIFPGRKLDRDGYGDIPEDVPKPELEDANPVKNYVYWSDKKVFDPMVELDYDEEGDIENYYSSMRNIELFDLFYAILPHYIKIVDNNNSFFKFIKVGEISSVVMHLEKYANDIYFMDTEIPEDYVIPEFLIRVGFVKNVKSCRDTVLGRLEKAKKVIREEVTVRIQATMIGDAQLARGIAMSADTDTLYNLENLECNEFIKKISTISTEEGTALSYASKAIRYMEEIESQLESLINTRLQDETFLQIFLEENLPYFEHMTKNVLDMLSATDQISDRSVLYNLYHSWQRAVDPVRSILNKQGLLDALESVKELSPRMLLVRTSDKLKEIAEEKNDSEIMKASEYALEMANDVNVKKGQTKGIKSGVKLLIEKLQEDKGYEKIINELQILKGCKTGDEYYRARFEAYVNAVNVAVYTESYISDARLKWNVRHLNALATKYFYKIYFKDLLHAYFGRKYLKGDYPERSCKNCFEPYKSDLGGIYNGESIVMITQRFWRWDELIKDMKEMLDNAINNAMKNDCNFPMAEKIKKLTLRSSYGGVYDQSMYGRFGWGSSMGGGYFGGEGNTFTVYSMRISNMKRYWMIGANKWGTIVKTGNTKEDEKTTAKTISTFEVPGIVMSPTEIVFEACSNGGTLIYSKYAGFNGKHRYLTVDEKGVPSWDNYMDIDSFEFSGCREGASGKQSDNFAGDIGESMRKVGESPTMNESDIMKTSDIIRLSNIETFVAEPSCDETDENGLEYCASDDTGLSPSDMNTKGLFQVTDIVNPPTRVKMGSTRRVIITSLSPREDKPQYENKRLIVLGINPETMGLEVTVLDDVPNNRNRAVIELVGNNINTNGPVVIGSSLRDENGGYPYFLTTTPSNIPDVSTKKMMKGGDVRVQSIKRMGWIPNTAKQNIHLSTALIAALISILSFQRSHYKTSFVSAAVGTGFFRSYYNTYANVNPGQAIASAIDSKTIIYNNLGQNSRNPFTDKSSRWILSIANQGIYPRFELVPYMLNVGTIGVNRREKANKTDAMYTLRDKENKNNSVIMIPANDLTVRGEGFTDDTRKVRFPPMLTEHDKFNFSRLGHPFYLYSPINKKFLVPPDKEDSPPQWVTATDSVPKTRLCTLKIANKQYLMKAVNKSDTVSKKIYDAIENGIITNSNLQFHNKDVVVSVRKEIIDKNQKLIIEQNEKNNSFMVFTENKADVLFGDPDSGIVVFVNNSRLSEISANTTWNLDANTSRMSLHYNDDRVLEAVWSEELERFTGELILTNKKETTNQIFTIVEAANCEDKIYFTEIDIFKGKELPVTDCLKPWYFYEMNLDDPDADEFTYDMQMEQPIKRINVEVGAVDPYAGEEKRLMSKVKHNVGQLGTQKFEWQRPNIEVQLSDSSNDASVIVVGHWNYSIFYKTWWPVENPDHGKPVATYPLRKFYLNNNKRYAHYSYSNLTLITIVIGPRTILRLRCDLFDTGEEVIENASYDNYIIKNWDGMNYPELMEDHDDHPVQLSMYRMGVPDENLVPAE